MAAPGTAPGAPGAPGVTPATPTTPATPAAAATGDERLRDYEAASRLDAATQQRTPTQQAGVRTPGEQSFEDLQDNIQRRLSSLTAEAPTPTSPLDAVRVNREQQVLAVTIQNLNAREQNINARMQLAQRLAQTNPQAAIQIADAVAVERSQLAVERQAANLLQANLNGQRSIISAASGNFEPLARDINIASGGVLRIQELEGGRFNILGGPNEPGPLATNVTRDQMIRYGRELYDNNYQSQMAAIRERATAVRRAVMDATIKGLEESFKGQAAASREIAVERAKAEAARANRSPNVQARLSTGGETITYTDAAGVVPDRILRLTEQTNRDGSKSWVWVPVEQAARPTQ
jgi:hypothetical protein